MKKIVIFGATGGIGAYTVMELFHDYEIIAVGRRPDNGFFKNIGAKYFSIDITKTEDFKKLPDDIFAVIHLAGAMPARMEGYEPQRYIDTIITGTLNVLNYARNTDRIIFSHSISDVSYLCGTTEPIREDAVSKPPENNDHSVYAISKIAAVNLIEYYWHKYGLKRFILRLPNIYIYHPNPYYYVDGLRVWQPYRLMIEKALRGKTLEIWGDPNQVKDIMYVKDLSRLIRLCLLSDKGGIYNAGTGIGVTLEDQVRGIADVFSGGRSEVIYYPDKKNTLQFIFDITKTKELGYEPIYDYYTYLLDFKQEMQINRFERLWGKG